MVAVLEQVKERRRVSGRSSLRMVWRQRLISSRSWSVTSTGCADWTSPDGTVRCRSAWRGGRRPGPAGCGRSPFYAGGLKPHERGDLTAGVAQPGLVAEGVAVPAGLADHHPVEALALSSGLGRLLAQTSASAASWAVGELGNLASGGSAGGPKSAGGGRGFPGSGLSVELIGGSFGWRGE